MRKQLDNNLSFHKLVAYMIALMTGEFTQAVFFTFVLKMSKRESMFKQKDFFISYQHFDLWRVDVVFNFLQIKKERDAKQVEQVYSHSKMFFAFCG